MTSRAAYQREWREKNKDKVLKYHQKYRDDNREKRRKWNRAWIANNRDRYNAAKYNYRDRCRTEGLKHYSDGTMKCKLCGFDNPDALCLDHINDDGKEHRDKMKVNYRNSPASGTTIYEALKREGYPPGLQVLCHNCNWLKEVSRRRAVRIKNPYYETNITL